MHPYSLKEAESLAEPAHNSKILISVTEDTAGDKRLSLTEGS